MTIYDARHRARRAELAKHVAAGHATCWRCRQPVHPGTPWDAGHIRPDLPAMVEHRSCNRAAAKRSTPTNQRARPSARVCVICGASYRANHPEQATCSRRCGAVYKRRRAAQAQSRCAGCWQRLGHCRCINPPPVPPEPPRPAPPPKPRALDFFNPCSKGDDRT